MTTVTPTPANILIVDDTPANLRLLAGMLSEQSYKVRPVPNGGLALTAAQAAPPDLILLDITMPELDGYKVARRLKADENTRDIPIIFISALDEILDKVKAFEAGGVDYITKPFQFEEVLARVETHLTLRRLQLELQQANEALEQRVQARTAELSELNQSLARFVPKLLLERLGKTSITDVHLGDQVQGTMAVMFADIRGFTTLSEQMGPQENFNFLNQFLGEVSPVIRENHGFVDKYLGDGIMAVFPDDPADAVATAIDMRRILARHNQFLTNSGYDPIQIGIGINTGSVMLGVIGETERIQGTVISDTVNVAARLEGMTKLYDIAIAVCQGTVRSIRDNNQYHYRFIDQVRAVGRKQTMGVFEVYDGDALEVVALKDQTKPDFEKGLDAYFARKFGLAENQFERVITQNPSDKVAQIQFERAKRYAVKGVADDWDGVEDLLTK
jgi:class 3 adenylate cyclase